MCFSLKNSNKDGKTEVKTETISNEDLPRIMNGWPDDPIKQPSFSLCATIRKKFKSWNEGWLHPLHVNPLPHNNGCHKLCDGGASNDKEVKLNNMQDLYKKMNTLFFHLFPFCLLILNHSMHYVLVKKIGIGAFDFNEKGIV